MLTIPFIPSSLPPDTGSSGYPSQNTPADLLSAATLSLELHT